MNAIIATIVFEFAAAATGAFGQEPPRVPGAQQAPVGHRQPTAKDVPSVPTDDAQANGVQADGSVAGIDRAIRREDKALDQKLNGQICRGC